jgi:hypothetical protein
MRPRGGDKNDVHEPQTECDRNNDRLQRSSWWSRIDSCDGSDQEHAFTDEVQEHHGKDPQLSKGQVKQQQQQHERLELDKRYLGRGREP